MFTLTSTCMNGIKSILTVKNLTKKIQSIMNYILRKVLGDLNTKRSYKQLLFLISFSIHNPCKALALRYKIPYGLQLDSLVSLIHLY